MGKLRVASLFSGIGGFEQGIFQAFGIENIEVVFASEIDKYASAAYHYMYSHMPNGDIRQVHAEDIPDHDLLVGGFPCQAFSVAGKRLGFEDTRGTLFFEVARILKAKTPKMFILENVKGLINHDKGKTLETILTTLSELEYTVDFRVMNSKFFGVPQSRERIYFVGIYDPDKKLTKPWSIPKGANSVEIKAKKRLNELGFIHSFDFGYPEQIKVTHRLRDILEPKVDAKYYLSDDKLAKLTASRGNNQAKDLKKIGFISKNCQGNYVYDAEGVSGTLASGTGGLGGSGGGLYVVPKVESVGNLFDNGYNSQCGRVYNTDGLSPTLRSSGDPEKILTEPSIEKVGEINRGQSGVILNPDGICNTLDTMQGGNRQPKILIEDAFYEKPTWVKGEEEVSNTVTCGGRDLFTPKHNWQHIHQGYRIRKLTPLECLRLQGFSEDTYRKMKEINISDSQVYKCAGNAVTTNVVEAVSRNLVEFVDGLGF